MNATNPKPAAASLAQSIFVSHFGPMFYFCSLVLVKNKKGSNCPGRGPAPLLAGLPGLLGSRPMSAPAAPSISYAITVYEELTELQRLV